MICKGSFITICWNVSFNDHDVHSSVDALGTLDSEVVNVQTPAMVSSTVEVSCCSASLAGAPHTRPPLPTHHAPQPLTLLHRLLRPHQPAPDHLGAGDPDVAVLVEPDLRLVIITTVLIGLHHNI